MPPGKRERSARRVPHVVHVNRHVIVANRRRGRREPPVVARRGRSGKAVYCQSLEAVDAQGNVLFRFLYEPEHPLKCGAEVFCEISPSLRLRLNRTVVRRAGRLVTCEATGNCRP